METTAIPPERTAAEIHTLLVTAGARQVLTEYNDRREITGIHFVMNISGQAIPFKMPVRTEPLLDHFIRRARKGGHYLSQQKTEDLKQKAKRVAWRQLLRWIEAQLAFIDAGMAEPAEIFMPYLQVSATETLYQRAVNTGFDRLALPPAPESVR